MNASSGSLVDWLEEAQKERPESFPSGINYFARYTAVADYLTKNVHPHVNAGAMIHDGGYLTGHGPEHINKVIIRASELLESANTLEPYEMYLLLVAIHVHDVGNIFGRKGHELSSEDVINDLRGRLGDDDIEKRWIFNLAQAHGGQKDGDKDKIGQLPPTVLILGKNVSIQSLAAILRFADELADDRERAARYLLLKDELPPESEVFHKYAESLHSVFVDYQSRSVQLHYDMSQADALRTWRQGEESIYLIDYIIERTLKTHLERIYCSRFMYSIVPLDSVSVKIEIYGKGLAAVPNQWSYKLERQGYPESPTGGAHELCPELSTCVNGKKLSGLNVADALRGQGSEYEQPTEGTRGFFARIWNKCRSRNQTLNT